MVTQAEKGACFVIAPIGEPDSETRRRSDQVLKYIIEPAVEECAYEATRADKIDLPGIITSQVIQRVVSDPLVIADLTETNPNVFYELAIRHAIRKPLVQIIKKGERIPFDIAGTRTIQVDHQDLDSVEAAKKEIIRQIRALESDEADLETPISVSLDLQLLRQSENPEERSLADMLATVSEVRNLLVKVEGRIGAKDDPAIVAELRGMLGTLLERESGRRVRNRRRFDPYYLRDVAHRAADQGDASGVLVMVSFYREEFPWLHELGMEVYRAAAKRNIAGAMKAFRSLREVTDMMLHGPFLEDTDFDRNEIYFLIKELPSVLDHLKHVVKTRRITKQSAAE